jgi:hypothetical protein
VALVVTTGTAVTAATSTDADGTYQLAVPAGTYQVKVELIGFTAVDRALTLTGDPCPAQVVDLQLALQPRAPRAAIAASAPGGRGRFETLNVQTQPS